MVLGNDEGEKTVEELPLNQKTIYLKANCDFTDKKDVVWFYYSLDNKNWKRIGSELKMSYTLPHFMGYRFGLFNYASSETGGFVDFDYFRIKNELD
jgi:beta-xylosidase